MRTIIPAPEPFSLNALIHSHGWIQLAPFVEHDGGTGFSYALQLEGGRVLDLCFSQAEDGIWVKSDQALTPEEDAEVREKATWMLGLEADLTGFYTLARQEPRLAHAAEKGLGRILRSATLFEDVIKTILTTNTLWTATIRMNRNLVEQFGEPVPENPQRRAFPTPQRLAEAGEETLRSVTRLGYRAPYILGLARQIALGELDLEALKTASLTTPELRKKLLALKGVGPYAAANLLMLLGHYDDIPVDSWALKLVSHEWYGGAAVGAAEVEAAFERWGPYKGLAYWLWNWTNTDL